jgi:hypothetical protein
VPRGTVPCCTTGGRRRGAALRLEARCHARAAEVLAVPPVLQPRRHCSAEVGNGTTDGPTFGNADSRCTRPAARSPRDTHRAQLPSGLKQSTYVSTGCGPDCAVMSAVMHETAAACRPSPLSCVAACRPRVAARCPALHHIMPHWLPCYLPRALIAFGKHSQVRCAAMKRDAMKYDAMR